MLSLNCRVSLRREDVNLVEDKPLCTCSLTLSIFVELESN